MPRGHASGAKSREGRLGRREKSLLNRVRAKVLGLQSPTRATSRFPARKKARTFNPVFHE